MGVRDLRFFPGWSLRGGGSSRGGSGEWSLDYGSFFRVCDLELSK